MALFKGLPGVAANLKWLRQNLASAPREVGERPLQAAAHGGVYGRCLGGAIICDTAVRSSWARRPVRHGQAHVGAPTVLDETLTVNSPTSGLLTGPTAASSTGLFSST